MELQNLILNIIPTDTPITSDEITHILLSYKDINMPITRARVAAHCTVLAMRGPVMKVTVSRSGLMKAAYIKI